MFCVCCKFCHVILSEGLSLTKGGHVGASYLVQRPDFESRSLIASEASAPACADAEFNKLIVRQMISSSTISRPGAVPGARSFDDLAEAGDSKESLHADAHPA